jgi:hypothetical protein
LCATAAQTAPPRQVVAHRVPSYRQIIAECHQKRDAAHRSSPSPLREIGWGIATFAVAKGPSRLAAHFPAAVVAPLPGNSVSTDGGYPPT